MKGIALLVLSALVALAGVTAANAFGLNPFQSRQIDRSQPTLLKSIQNVSRFQAAVGNFEK
jgi:long-subunit fatty acid transport protein